MSAFDEPVIERLRVELTQAEIVVRAESLARYMAETVRLRDEARALAKESADQLKLRAIEEQERAQDLVLGSEEREVNCLEVPRFADRLVDIVRADTREVVRTRALQPDERQAELFEPEPPPEKPTKH